MGGAMALTNAKAGHVDALDEASTGPVHDFGWHRQNRGRRSAQWVDVAMVAAWGGLIAWVLLHR
jgi:hypothetical protein